MIRIKKIVLPVVVSLSLVFSFVFSTCSKKSSGNSGNGGTTITYTNLYSYSGYTTVYANANATIS